MKHIVARKGLPYVDKAEGYISPPDARGFPELLPDLTLDEVKENHKLKEVTLLETQVFGNFCESKCRSSQFGVFKIRHLP